MQGEVKRHTPRFSQELFPEKRSTLHVAAQHAALAVAARCIGHRSTVRTGGLQQMGKPRGKPQHTGKQYAQGRIAPSGRKSKKGGMRAMALPEAKAVQWENYPHTMNLSR